MALIDRLARDVAPPAEGFISNHAWSAAMWFLSKGDVTRAQVVTAFNLTVTDQVQLDQLITFHGTLNATEKGQFHNRLEAAGILLEAGIITRAKYKLLLGMT